MVTFEVFEKEMQSGVRIDLQNDEVRTEAGALYYMRGSIEMDAKMPTVGGMFKSMLTKEKAVRPTYKGTGEIYLEPSFGTFTIFELDGSQEWVLDKGAYYASEMSVNVEMFTNKAIQGLFSGEGFFQTKVSGTGKVVVSSQGPLEKIELTNDKLVVDGSFAVARTAGLEYRVQKASKGLFGSVISGEVFVNTFTGSGTVYIAPAPHRFMYLQNSFAGIMTALSARKGS